MAIKKTVSLQNYVYEAAKEKSKLLFCGNFSAYITYLLSRDNEQNIKDELNVKSVSDN